MKAEEQRTAYTAARSTVPVECPIVPFEQAATPQSDRGKRIKQRDYLPEGRIPVIDQGQAPVGGYTDDEDFAFAGELPVVLFGDHTRAVKLVSHRFAVGADGIKIFRPAEGVRPKYLYYWMKSARIPDRGYGRHYQYLRQLSVPLPPPAKQDEIVAEIEKQFSRLDEAVANLKRVKANLKRYKAAVLKAAVEGRLVETEAELARREGRSYETGAQLLQRILETRRSQWQGKGKYKEPAAPDTADLPELPEGWVWATLEQLCPIFVDSAHRTPKYEIAGFPAIGPRDVVGGHLRLDSARVVSEEEYLIQVARRVPKGGDIVYSRELSLGWGAIVPDGANICLSQGMCLFRPDESVSVSYFMYSLNGPDVRNQATRGATGSAHPHLNLGDIKGMKFSLPPQAEQYRIVAEVDRRLSLLRGTEAQVDANLQRAERLRQSILQCAFSKPSLKTVGHVNG